METTTTTVMDRIPQHFVDKFHIDIMGNFLRAKSISIALSSIRNIEDNGNYIMIVAGQSGIFLYEDGEISIVIT